MMIYFVELETCLQRAGQFNLEALYHSACGDGGGNSCRVWRCWISECNWGLQFLCCHQNHNYL